MEKKTSMAGRYNTNDETKRIVWIHAAGHCELCGKDLTYDYRVGKRMKWGEVAHILPASPKGPRGNEAHSHSIAESLTNDDSNLMLLCPGCHDKIDRDSEGYPKTDLTPLHQAFRERVQLAASTPDGGRAIALIVQSQHHKTVNEISERDLLTAMSSEGLTAIDHPIKITFRPPDPQGRDDGYWQNIKDDIQYKLEGQLKRRGGQHGDAPTLALVGLADIPALMVLGQAIGDRSKRLLFSSNREHGLSWPDQDAVPPEYSFTPPSSGSGPIALILSISAQIPDRDVHEALPDARVAELSIPDPNYMMVKNRNVIHAFRNALQECLSQIEAMTADTIHVFSAIPAALAIEFGALLTTNHQRQYLIYDREQGNNFEPTLRLGFHAQEN